MSHRRLRSRGVMDDRITQLLPRPRTVRLTGGVAGDPPTLPSMTDATLPRDAYRLRIVPGGISVTSSSAAGAFYAGRTLAQLRRLYGSALPSVEIDDSPDFAARGVMLDVSRDKVPTVQTLFRIVDELANLKINQLQLYTEHTFAYRDHAAVWENASPLTAAEIRELDAYCRARFVELVPNQNSFGHMERWLKHAPYAAMAEAPNGFVWPSGARCDEPFSLSPTDPKSLELIASLYDELLPNFASKLFNVGCDETFDLGQPGTRSEAVCKSRGTHRVYLDYLLQIHRLCAARGKRMMFWGDIIIQSPELVPELPKDAIALEWGYEADHPFDEHLAKFKSAGLDFYVCPGTSTWLSFAGRTTNATGNLLNAAEAGLRHGAVGFLNTDWGDHGHWQYWPASYIPLAYGAGVSWCVGTNRDLNLNAINTHVFNDRSNTCAQVFSDLGDVYRLAEPIGNSTRLFRILQKSRADLSAFLKPADAEAFRAQHEAARAISARIGSMHLGRDDALLISEELHNTIRLMQHAAQRGLWCLGDPSVSPDALRADLAEIITTHQRLWRSRNRDGGLADSVFKLTARGADYQDL